ncbi:hypothetical protein FE257_007757 [Aspergillus nanangensis]|uniref:LysM domain-containing protein n=1 Tax=Aspergillus nanangensis TaxID=2582783 RepID=A0AAD4CWY5_ASPNN|nr:hypothetical protein FE257_007757 [Aspergillus nanangensis]
MSHQIVNEDGSCASYSIQKDDGYNAIAKKNHITKDKIEKLNKDTWGWAGCDNLQANQRICLSEGEPPMPAPLPNAVCGPQCGITKNFCIKKPADTGAPGTSNRGANRYVANCGMDIANNNDPPARIAHVAYFEAFNRQRPPEGREMFANAVVAFFKDNKLDGVDFDWEYPAAPDIPGVPPGIQKEGEQRTGRILQKMIKSKCPHRYSP